MRWTRLNIILTAAVVAMSAGLADAQSLPKGFLFGLSGGTQKLVTYNKRSGLGLGVEGLLGRRFSSSFGGSLVLGFATVPFNFPGLTPTGTRQSVAVKSSLLYAQLLFDFEIVNSGKLHPYLMIGAGGMNYKGFRPALQQATNKRINDGSAIAGLGVRYLVSPTVALNFNGAFHYTTSQNLDTQPGGPDNYASMRFGITKFLGRTAMESPFDETFSDLSVFDESSGEASAREELRSSDNLQSLLADLEDSGDDGLDNAQRDDMEEYIRLKSQVEEINQEIDSKESEISSLQTALVSQKEQVVGMQKNLQKMPKKTAAAPAAPSSSFSRAYEDALNSFYLKRYAEASEKFSTLLDQFPNHSLASNCYYWRGEAEYQLGNSQTAIADFKRVLEYAKSLKRDDALLMLGQCYAKLNRRQDAREAFDRLIQEFPSSEFVAKAEELRDKI